MLSPVPHENIVYRWSSGAYFVSAFVAEKIWIGITGKYSWRLVALHNVVLALVTSALLGVLAFRLARRLGAELLHALGPRSCRADGAVHLSRQPRALLGAAVADVVAPLRHLLLHRGRTRRADLRAGADRVRDDV